MAHAPTVTAPEFRAAQPVSVDAPTPNLGPLQDLPGTWVGSGFNLIARPAFQLGQPFFLELNATRETLNFTEVAPIPNRGSVQNDIEYLGLTYVQQVSDAVTNGLLHIEPGMWLNLPATSDPQADASVARLATIPHGDALVAQGTFFTIDGPPQIAAMSSTPLKHGTTTPLTDPTYLAPYTHTALPAGIPSGSIADPTTVLRAAIAGQEITNTIVLSISTSTTIGGSAGGIENIPFVVTNANAMSLDAIFWIETVSHPEQPGRSFLQVQYVQRVLLSFLDIDWPHISVGTLIKN